MPKPRFGFFCLCRPSACGAKPKKKSHDMKHIPLETIFELNSEHRPLRKIMADTPGRNFTSTGPRRSAMEYHSDPVRDEIRTFAALLCGNT